MQKGSALRTAFRQWLPLAAIIVVLAGTFYVAVQQNYRMSANDPQIQIAEDIAAAITQGTAAPDAIVPPTPSAEMSPSLATFVAIYSATGTPIGSSVSLNGKLPTLPDGVFAYVKQHGEDRFTWQPQPGVRIAAVVTQFTGQSSGFVLAGRSIKEIEIRERQLGYWVAGGGVMALVLSLLILYFLARPVRPETEAGMPAAEHHPEHHHGHEHRS